MLALEWLRDQDADASGFLDPEQDAAGLPFTIRQIAAPLDFQTDLLKHQRGTLQQERTLRDAPGFQVSQASSPPLFANVGHVGIDHIKSQIEARFPSAKKKNAAKMQKAKGLRDVTADADRARASMSQPDGRVRRPLGWLGRRH
ncbi:MAG: hypothetical protein ABSH24_19120 [Bryobacteraceae bacterium]|jgi:hypothetical protein